MAEKEICYTIRVVFMYRIQAAKDLRKLGITVNFSESLAAMHEVYDAMGYLYCMPSQANGIQRAKPYWLVSISKYYDLVY